MSALPCSTRHPADFLPSASPDQGQWVDATIGDLCPGCSSGSIDLSPSAFQQLASLDAGRIQVSWDFE